MPMAIVMPKAVEASAADRVGLGITSSRISTAEIPQPTEPTRRASRARSAADRIRVHWMATA